MRGTFVTAACNRLQTAVDGHGDEYVRSRTFAHLKLASLVMATGDPHEAATIGRAAVDDAEHVRSQRARSYLQELGTLTTEHHILNDVAELRQQIGGATKK